MKQSEVKRFAALYERHLKFTLGIDMNKQEVSRIKNH
jgi:hypothetical protein